ncbi:uncharacterized protein [Argopecten irradians]|uniref:uncharacterized protein n=1 Tax=Argopecten irradians TaxID=31199 RepID=UPI00371178DF
MITQDERLEGLKFNTSILEDRLGKLEYERDMARDQCYEREGLLELQTRSMKDNLIFGGLGETGLEENTELVVKDFIKSELDITKEIVFQVVHRLGKRADGKPRSIVAKFVNRKDRDRVLNAASTKLASKRQFSINEHFPPEINERRRVLYPVFKEAKRNNRQVRLKADKLFIDGQQYHPPPPQHHPDSNALLQEDPHQPQYPTLAPTRMRPDLRDQFRHTGVSG